MYNTGAFYHKLRQKKDWEKAWEEEFQWKSRKDKEEAQENARRSSSNSDGLFSFISELFSGSEGGSDWLSFMGPESGGSGAEGSGGSAGGGSAVGNLGIFAAAFAVQHMLSNMTDREYEGQKTDDLFGGSLGTEPWLAYVKDLFGAEDPTSGEKFDAAVKNEDYPLAAIRLPSMLHYWFNPAQQTGYEFMAEGTNEYLATAMFPLEGIFSHFEAASTGDLW